MTSSDCSTKTEALKPRALKQSMPIALSRAREAVMAHFRPLLAERGYTEQQWRVLRVLNEQGPLDATSLARHAALLLPSLTRILKVLEEKNAITREVNPTDSRRSLITLENSIRDYINTEMQKTEAIYEDIIRQFGEENTAELLRLLERLAELAPPASADIR
jgi:homoprotocatechuate degradation regulator HpaR